MSLRRILHSLACLGLTLPATNLTAASPLALRTCDDLDLTVSVSLSDDRGFEGLYKYSLEAKWGDGSYKFGRVEIAIPHGNCDCACSSGIVTFATPAGTASGMDSQVRPCTIGYHGGVTCKRARSTPPEPQNPIVQFDQIPAGCQADTVVAAAWCFYSTWPPAPWSEFPHAVSVKDAGSFCTARVRGQFPMCSCRTAALPCTWGRMKSFYR